MRRCIWAVLAAGLVAGTPRAEAQGEVRQATGMRVVEVGEDSAVVWTRLTAGATAAEEGGARPAAGRVRLRYVSMEGLRAGAGPVETNWEEVGDGVRVFRLEGLEPGMMYWVSVETEGPGGMPVHGALRGRFTTAPRADQAARVLFTVASGYAARGAEGPRGFEADVAVNNMEPAFHCVAGGAVDYLGDTPKVDGPASAREHWERMFGFPRRVELSRYMPMYFLPGKGDLEAPGLGNGVGREIYREWTAGPEPAGRDFRWGKDLHVWLVEGEERGERLEGSMAASDATFKVVVSAGPVIGSGLARRIPGGAVVVSGGTGWQGHLVDPESGLHEFARGPASDALAGKVDDAAPARFQREGGGFASVLADRDAAGGPTLVVRLHGPDGKVVHEFKRGADAGKPVVGAAN